MAYSTSRTTPNPSTLIQTAVIPDAKASIITGAIDARAAFFFRPKKKQLKGTEPRTARLT
jgi:hypothetical protein